jgi:alanine racemase
MESLSEDISLNLGLLDIEMPCPTHCWIELNQQAFEHNIAQYRSIIGTKGKLALVVKSNAYGHGIKKISLHAQSLNAVDWLCVNSLSEALALRAWLIKKPILMLGFLDRDPELAIYNHITVMVDRIETLSCLEHAASRLHTIYDVHIKIDTGMHRFGFVLNDIAHLIEQLHTYTYVHVTGIYTHFADADNSDQTYTHQQYALFQCAINLFHQAGIYPELIHCANTAATSSFLFPGTNFFRIGAGAYGLWPSPATQQATLKNYPQFCLKQVMAWKTYIYDIKTINSGDYVSYGLAYQAHKKIVSALLPVGFYDGYQRRLGNIGQVRIGTMYAPVIGRVAMNALWIDITRLSGVKKGDEVVLIGDDPMLSAAHIAHAIGSFNPREITVSINPHIARTWH